jgi:hypothetical protein
MPQIKEIKVTLTDGSDLVFQPKHEGLIKIMKGVHKEPIGMMSHSYPNGNEALIIVCAPEGVREFFKEGYDIEYWITEELNKAQFKLN